MAKEGAAAKIGLTVAGLPRGRILVQHYRVDDRHSNAYEAWKRMGSPQQPSSEQYALQEAAAQLEFAESPRWTTAENGKLSLDFELPLHGVSLIRMTW